MSTDHQQYSVANQSAVIQEYANAHGIEIVRTYVDRGKSGLGLGGRRALMDLLKTVESKQADFSLLLVYDVSRWGRFQDVDESAYYEHTLKRAGIPIIYCAEPFSGSGGPTDVFLKTLKRTMAAEYSRELSVKVFAAQCRIARLGFLMGGPAGFGFRRVAIEPAGTRRVVLQTGQQKQIHTDRVILVPGPANEVRLVREIFELFVEKHCSEERIAAHLNGRGLKTALGNRWEKRRIRAILLNPKYAGDMVFNRVSMKLQNPRTVNPRDEWVVAPDVIEPIVSRETFNRAQVIFQRRAQSTRREEMLTRLKAVLKKHGRLSAKLIDREAGVPITQTYRDNFGGSLLNAYDSVGWKPGRIYHHARALPQTRQWQSILEEEVEQRLTTAGASFRKSPRIPVWKVNGEVSIVASVIRCQERAGRSRVWNAHLPRAASADIFLAARLNCEGDKILDYFVFPGKDLPSIQIHENNPLWLAVHCFHDLAFLDLIARRYDIQRLA
jgi:DNA invertase Pin-like site-specific DNA recombinase